LGDKLAERFEELAHQVLAPLVLGGPVNAVRPFGGRLGLRLGIQRQIMDLDLRSRLDVARVRRARLLAPVDTVRPLDEGDWAVLAALNDLLQLTNHHLAGPLTRGRYARLLANIEWLCERIPAPGTIEDALARHVSFARSLEIVRTDSAISWWTGSARFRGEVPPSRLLAWKEIRRVQIDATKIPLSEMSLGVQGLSPDAFTEVLGLWLTRSPLTDLATATRKTPVFGWSASTLSLIATAPGRSLAFRSMLRQPADLVPAVLHRAAKSIPVGYEEAKALAEGFLAEVKAGLKLFGEVGAGGSG
jgi:hypothetical protein